MVPSFGDLRPRLTDTSPCLWIIRLLSARNNAERHMNCLTTKDPVDDDDDDVMMMIIMTMMMKKLSAQT